MRTRESTSAWDSGQRWSPLFVLILSLIATAGVTAFVFAAGEKAERARFDRVAERTRTAISNHMDHYGAVLRNMTALFQTGGIPSRPQFHEYVERLDVPRHYPGLQGIGFSLRFTAAERETIARTGAEHIDPLFALWPADPPRDEYHAIFYLEPLDERNRLAIGYDMHSEPVRAAAMDEARDAAEPRASGRVKLIQEGEDPQRQAGFLIYSPLYKGKERPGSLDERRAKLYGYIYAPFRSDDLMRNIFHDDPEAEVDFLLYDGDGPTTSADRLLHDSSTVRGAAVASRPRHTRTDSITVAGRRWTIQFVTRPGFGGASRWVAALIFALGLLLGITLFTIVRSQVRALAAERRAIAELKSSEAALRQAKDVAEAASRAKDEFLATVSHELRTPLNAILGWSQLIRASGGAASGDVSQGLEVIERNCRAQVRLVEDLLDVGRTASGTMRLDVREVELASVVDSALESIKPAADAKGVRLERVACAGGSSSVRGDPARLQQVFWNLISNAVKFTGGGGRVRVLVEPAESALRVIVADTGEGIPSEFLPRLFHRFTQADASSTRRHGGLGLGLAITRELVELHGGTVRADSGGLGKGATFTVELPPAPASAAQAPEAHRSSEGRLSA